jgi:hypothetical protein
VLIGLCRSTILEMSLEQAVSGKKTLNARLLELAAVLAR